MWSRGHHIRLLWTTNSSLFLGPHHRYRLFALNRTKYVWTRQLPFTSYREAGSVPSKNEGSLVTSVLRECDESFMRIDDGLSESSNLTWNKEVCPAKKKQKQNSLYNLFTCLQGEICMPRNVIMASSCRKTFILLLNKINFLVIKKSPIFFNWMFSIQM